MSTEHYLEVISVPTKGASLASALNSRIDAMATGDRSRGDVIEAMGSAAGISASTVNQL